jgi:hypothetical protein
MTSIATLNLITRETEKAIQIDTGDRLVWVPKSVTVIEGDVVMCKNWFAKKNGIGVYGYRSCNVG